MNRTPVELRHLADLQAARRKRSIAGTALSPREREVFAAYLDGLPLKEIGARLNMSVKTVCTHKATIVQKLGAKHDVDLVRIAIRHGWMSV